MIELALKTALERITGMSVYPLLLPIDILNGITYQRISDPEVDTGLVRSKLIAGRFQITLYLLDDYTELVRLDGEIWAQWRQIVHGDIEGYPVQYIERVGIQEGSDTLTDGSVLYRRIRDYMIYFSES